MNSRGMQIIKKILEEIKVIEDIIAGFDAGGSYNIYCRYRF